LKHGDNFIGPNSARRDRFFSLDGRQSYRQQLDAGGDHLETAANRTSTAFENG
jgi:hypothetical protein